MESKSKTKLRFLENMFNEQEKEGKDVARRRKVSRRYYKKLMPTIYTDFFGLIEFTKKYCRFSLVCLDPYTGKSCFLI